MCLRKAVPYKSEKDIIGYKVLAHRSSSGWYSSLTDKYYFYKTDGTENKARGELKYDAELKTVGEGALHMFKKKIDAVRYCRTLSKNTNRKNYVIAKCEIPKDCGYVFRGIQSFCDYFNEYDVTGYCGEKMKILEIEKLEK